MRKLILNILILIATLPHYGAWSADLSEIKKLVFKVEEPHAFRFYGTAILFSNSKEAAYFITNWHIAHTAYEQKSKLNLFGEDAQSLETSVIAALPQYDLAILKSDQPIAINESTNKLLTTAFNETLIEPGLIHSQVIGYENHSRIRIPLVKNRSWKDEATQIEDIALTDWPFNQWPQLISVYESKSPELMLLEVLETCPTLGLSKCYRIPMRSWGFSGSPLIRTEPDGSSSIIGMVSHFSPLSSDTYAIPMSLALSEARKSLLPGEGKPTLADSAELRLDAETVVRSNNIQCDHSSVTILSKGGGGDHCGGGGGDHCGGRCATGGGGSGFASQLGNYPVIRFTDDDFWFVAKNEDLIKDIRSPDDWFKCDTKSWVRGFVENTKMLKGVTALFEYRPGVTMIKNGVKTVINDLDSHPISGLTDFQTLIRKNPLAELNADPGLKTPPAQMEFAPERTGLRVSVPLTYTDEVVGTVENSDTYPTPITRATWKKDDMGKYIVSIDNDQLDTHFKMTFNSEFTYLGADTFSYSGDVKFEGFNPPAFYHDARFILQRDAETREYSLKGLVIYAPAYPMKRIFIDGFDIPLVEKK